ncbi:MAG TPA: DUF881 domain-containing protein [Clostridia bacterium]|nr:DUF881 domain-containing protein [Clostridia bacterium]
MNKIACLVSGLRKYSGQSVLLLICFILGFGLTIQIKSVYQLNSGAASNDIKRAEDLQKRVSELGQKNKDLYNQVEKLQSALDDYRAKAAKSGSYADTLNKQLQDAEILAGLADVHGKGVIVTLDDAEQSASTNAFVVHDSDILQVLNELRDAGAEALSINDERILSTSEVRCAGNTISVNDNRYSAPFVIKAIGNPDKLRSAIMMKDGIADVLGQWGIKVNVESSDGLYIKAYEGMPKYQYAGAVNNKK